MDEDDAIDFLGEVKDKLPLFIDEMRGNKPGFFRHTFSGDIINENVHWGLFNSVCAGRILYILNSLSSDNSKEISDYILSFEKESGYIYDETTLKYSFISRFIGTVMTRRMSSLSGILHKRAETRSSLTCLLNLGIRISGLKFSIPVDEKEITKYISQLNWNLPWGAGSHFSALIFFLNYPNQNSTSSKIKWNENLINFAFREVEKYRRSNGSWGLGKIDPIQEVNGSMKMVLAYQWADNKLNMVDRLIDLCLNSKKLDNGCNNLDIITVLYECLKYSDHRSDEIRLFLNSMLEIYRNFWFPQFGGFSFYKNKSISNYYGAKIAESKSEPDIHGSWLNLYGLAMISDICGYNKHFGFKIPKI